jgi:hypothetical protein
VLQAPAQASDPRLPSRFVTIVGSSCMRGCVAREQRAGTDDDRGGHRHEGACLPAPRGQAVRQGRARGVLGASRRVRPRRQARAQGAVALAGLACARCARAFVMPRRDPAPGGQAGGGTQARHREPPLGDPPLSTPVIDARHGVQPRDRPRTGQGGRRGGRRRGAAHATGGPHRGRRGRRGRGGPARGAQAGDVSAPGVTLCRQDIDLGPRPRHPSSVMLPHPPGQGRL